MMDNPWYPKIETIVTATATLHDKHWVGDGIGDGIPRPPTVKLWPETNRANLRIGHAVIELTGPQLASLSQLLTNAVVTLHEIRHTQEVS